MPFVCGFVCVNKSRKKTLSKNKATMDFRRADPKYVNFTPKNCFDAIDLFNRHRNLGLSSALFPECFVHCARALPAEELDKFHRFIINPNGDIETGGEKPSAVDKEIEEERAELEQEAINRDMENLTIDEEGPTEMSQEDEKVADSVSECMEEEYIKISVD